MSKCKMGHLILDCFLLWFKQGIVWNFLLVTCKALVVCRVVGLNLARSITKCHSQQTNNFRTDFLFTSNNFKISDNELKFFDCLIFCVSGYMWCYVWALEAYDVVTGACPDRGGFCRDGRRNNFCINSNSYQTFQRPIFLAFWKL